MFNHLKEEGLSQSEIAHRTGHDRKTVKIYLALGIIKPVYKHHVFRPGNLTF